MEGGMAHGLYGGSRRRSAFRPRTACLDDSATLPQATDAAHDRLRKLFLRPCHQEVLIELSAILACRMFVCHSPGPDKWPTSFRHDCCDRVQHPVLEQSKATYGNHRRPGPQNE